MQVSPQYRRKLHLRQSQIQFFSGGREGPRIPRQTRAYGAREKSPVSPVFRVPPFKPLATSLSTDLLVGFKGPILGEDVERREKRKGREKI